MKTFKGELYLFTTALIWGFAIFVQTTIADQIGSFTFNGIRNFIGAIALLPCIAILNRFEGKKEKKAEGTKRDLITGGIACGLCLFIASSLQQIGLQYTTTGKAGFITAFYIVLVPVLGIFLHKKTGWKVWLAVIISIVGLYFLCITEKLTIGRGDIFIFICALIFAVHIMIIDYFSPKVDGVKMSCIQFLVCGTISLIPMFWFESPTVSGLILSIGPLLYAGVLSSGVAYTLQIIGQKGVNPAIASLILSLESCFAVLAGWLVLGQKLSVRESIGCMLMFTAIILAQLPEKNRRND